MFLSRFLVRFSMHNRYVMLEWILLLIPYNHHLSDLYLVSFNGKTMNDEYKKKTVVKRKQNNFHNFFLHCLSCLGPAHKSMSIHRYCKSNTSSVFNKRFSVLTHFIWTALNLFYVLCLLLCFDHCYS